jgi:hypothetical protein
MPSTHPMISGRLANRKGSFAGEGEILR